MSGERRRSLVTQDGLSLSIRRLQRNASQAGLIGGMVPGAGVQPFIPYGSTGQFFAWDKTWRSASYVGGFYNVKDYGATGDGSTDDTAAIQAAIDAAYDAGGGTVYLPSATYRTTAAIVLKSRVNVLGADALTTSIKPYHASTHDAAFKVTDKSYYFSVRNLKIDFTNCGTPSAEAEDIGIQMTEADKFSAYYLLEDLWIYRAHTAYKDTNGGWQSTVRRVWSKMCRNGFWKEYGTTVAFESCFAEGNKDTSKDGRAWNFYRCWDHNLTACAMDNFYSANGFRAEETQGLTINGFTAEFNETDASAGSRIFYFLVCQGTTINGLTPLSNKIVPADNSTSVLLLINGGSGVLNGLQVGGGKLTSAWDDVCRDGNASSVAELVRIGGTAPAWAINGSKIIEIPTQSGETFTGTKRSIIHADNAGATAIVGSQVTGTILDSHSKIATLGTF